MINLLYKINTGVLCDEDLYLCFTKKEEHIIKYVAIMLILFIFASIISDLIKDYNNTKRFRRLEKRIESIEIENKIRNEMKKEIEELKKDI